MPETDHRSQGHATEARASFSHMALNYLRPQDAPKIDFLMRVLGFDKVQELDFGPGGIFFQYVVDPAHVTRGDGIIYVSLAPKPVADTVAAVRAALRVGEADENPCVGALRAYQQSDPEACFHLGILFHRLEALESLFLRLMELNETDPLLRGHLKVTLNAALPGVPEIDARMASSPLFRGVTRYPYGRHAVQAFVETDLLMSGPLGESMVIEADYLFPGYDKHLFNHVGAG